MKNRPVFIYALTDPAGNIRYVGQSVQPEIRYMQHVRESAGTNKAEWISELLRNGTEPILIILERTDKANADYKEKWWITLGRTRGWQLSNMGNPSRSSPDFAALFADQIRSEFDQFVIEHDPVLFVTRRDLVLVAKTIHVLVGFLVGLFIGWQAYRFEAMFAPSFFAICYGIAVSLMITQLNYQWAIKLFDNNATWISQQFRRRW